MMSLVVEVLLTVPPGGASLTHISQADGNSEGVQVSVCTWGNVSESRKWKCGVLPLKKLFSFCVQEWEKLEAVLFIYFLFCIFFLIQITHFLVYYSYCPHTWCVHFWLEAGSWKMGNPTLTLPTWGKHVWHSWAPQTFTYADLINLQHCIRIAMYGIY